MSDVYVTALMWGLGLVIGAWLGLCVVKLIGSICDVIDEGIEAARKKKQRGR